MGSTGFDDGPRLRPILSRVAIEFGPLLLFFIAFKAAGVFVATGAFLAATVGITAISFVQTQRWPLVPSISTLILAVMGGLTLWLGEERFIKMRPTVMNGLYAAALFGSLVRGRPLLERVMAGSVHLTPAGWRGLTWRVGLFLAALALANEAVWRLASTETWVTFKVFVVLPLDGLFALAMWPYVKRHAGGAATAA